MSNVCDYWIVEPKSLDCLDSLPFEIVYVYFDGKFKVYRPGLEKPFATEEFLYYKKAFTDNKFQRIKNVINNGN